MNGRQVPLITAIAGVVVAILVVVLLVLPEANRVRDTNTQITQAVSQQDTLRVELAQLQSDQQQAPHTRRVLARLNGKVPPTTDLPGLIRLLNSAANRAGVSFMSVSPATPTPPSTGPQVSVIPVSVTVSGGFWSIDEFMYRLENLPRLATMGTASFTRSAPAVDTLGTTTITATVQVSFFTTDTSAGPGSQPGSQTASTTTPTTVPGTSASPSPSPTA